MWVSSLLFVFVSNGGGGFGPAMDLPDGLVENGLEIPLGESRALEILPRADLLGTVDTHLECYRSHALLVQARNGIGVLAQIELGAHQDDGDAGGVMLNLGVPLSGKSQHLLWSIRVGRVTNLGLDVVERRRADEGEADEEDVGLGVRKRAQSVVILLSSSIPETQAHGLAIDHNTRRVVIESIAARVSVSGATVVGRLLIADKSVEWV